jgi:hypothetical protein
MGWLSDVLLQVMPTAIRIAELISGIAAAILWFCSAKIRIKEVDMHFDGSAPEFLKSLRLQSRLSACAAVSTGIAVLCQIAEEFIPKA